MSECHEWLSWFIGMVAAWIGIWINNRLRARNDKRDMKGKTG
jgi:hypothetical protein